jgi:hypothetical protein
MNTIVFSIDDIYFNYRKDSIIESIKKLYIEANKLIEDYNSTRNSKTYSDLIQKLSHIINYLDPYKCMNLRNIVSTYLEKNSYSSKEIITPSNNNYINNSYCYNFISSNINFNRSTTRESPQFGL